MTIIAALVIDADTDELVQTQGFDVPSFTIINAGGQWLIDLDPEIAGANPLARQVITETNSTQNVTVRAAQRGVVPTNPFNQLLIQAVNNGTGVIEPLVGALAQVYVVVQRIFSEPQL